MSSELISLHIPFFDANAAVTYDRRSKKLCPTANLAATSGDVLPQGCGNAGTRRVDMPERDAKQIDAIMINLPE
jgi:hypothetical protein